MKNWLWKFLIPVTDPIVIDDFTYSGWLVIVSAADIDAARKAARDYFASIEVDDAGWIERVKPERIDPAVTRVVGWAQIIPPPVEPKT